MAEDLRRFLDDEPIRARQSSSVERYWRWAHRNPWIAALGAALATLLVAVTIASLIAVSQFADLAKRQENSAAAERASRMAAQAETYRAMLSEVRALRAGHPLGWRDDALGNLARLAAAATPRRDLVELRSEAVALCSASSTSSRWRGSIRAKRGSGRWPSAPTPRHCSLQLSTATLISGTSRASAISGAPRIRPARLGPGDGHPLTTRSSRFGSCPTAPWAGLPGAIASNSSTRRPAGRSSADQRR